MHNASVAATLPERSVASYPALMSSVNAKTPAPAAAVVAAVNTVTLVFGCLWVFLEYPEELVVYCLAIERCVVLTWATSSWVRQFEHVHDLLLARRPSELIEGHFMVARF